MIGPTALQRDAELPAAVPRRPGDGADRRSTSTASCSSCASASSTSSATPARRGLLPVAVEPHARLQGHAHHAAARRVLPRPARRPRRVGARRWCTAASPPTRSRRGRSRTRTATSPTTARSTRVQGNRNWMRAREALLAARRSSRDLERAFPIFTPGASDTASFDECLELLHLGGRPIWHAVLMMIPEAWENHATMSAEKRAFYRYHASLMEPWDGPASIAFTDGTVDRRGARPQRPAPEPLLGHRRRPRDHGAARPAWSTSTRRRSCRRAACSPGRMFLVDTAKGRIVDDDEIKAELAGAQPVRASGSSRASCTSTTCPTASTSCPATSRCCAASRRSATRTRSSSSSSRRWRAPAARRSARWAPTRRSRCCPTGSRLLFDYFQQLFAQVTNPPLDAIREELVTSLSADHRARGQPARAAARSRAAQVELPFPIIDNDELAKLIHIDDDGDRPEFAAAVHLGPVPRRRRRRRRCARRSTACAPRRRPPSPTGKRILVLSDRDSDAELAPIPSLLLTSAVHHHLIREKTRTQVGLVVEAGDAREVHHMALLARLRRRRHQPVPRVRVDRGPHRRRSCTASARSTRRPRSRTTSRPRARACSR